MYIRSWFIALMHCTFVILVDLMELVIGILHKINKSYVALK